MPLSGIVRQYSRGKIHDGLRIVAQHAPQLLRVLGLLPRDPRDPVAARAVRDVLVVSRLRLPLPEKELAVFVRERERRRGKQEDVPPFQNTADFAVAGGPLSGKSGDIDDRHSGSKSNPPVSPGRVPE